MRTGAARCSSEASSRIGSHVSSGASAAISKLFVLPWTGCPDLSPCCTTSPHSLFLHARPDARSHWMRQKFQVASTRGAYPRGLLLQWTTAFSVGLLRHCMKGVQCIPERVAGPSISYALTLCIRSTALPSCRGWIQSLIFSQAMP